MATRATSRNGSLWFMTKKDRDDAARVLYRTAGINGTDRYQDKTREGSGRPSYFLRNDKYSSQELEKALNAVPNPRYTVYDESGKPVLKTFRGKTAKAAARVIEGSVKRFGKKVFSGKRNPSGAAAELYEEFHGKPSDRVIELHESVHEHGNEAEIGDMHSLDVITESGFDANIIFESEPGEFPVKLSSSEDGRQLFFFGGDQEIDLNAFDMGSDEWIKDLMLIGVLYRVTYTTEKGFDDFELTDYHHRLGEETKVEPVLLYDYRNRTLSVAGGQYRIEAPGIIN